MRFRPRHAGLPLALAATFACDEGLAPLPEPTTCPAGFVGICGTVTFRGAVPESTAFVYVVAYQTFPQTRAELFSFQPPQTALQPLRLDTSSAFYTTPLANGRYEWVLAAWVKQGFTPANADSTLREAGFYRGRGGADTTRFGSGIVVVSGAGTDSIDFAVDFTNMHPVSFYFPLAVRQAP